ncbi:hypothetical protein FH972_012184 [Carpinus fangiana]|uniref:protein disulfide-isomerase n=1 Tax=Carpinus fangiana TaxID=176857 RepID=A0A5N6R6D6_9ROSI|nr:hypothetical protein FH972_012184 [Carpinus fangiana]
MDGKVPPHKQLEPIFEATIEASNSEKNVLYVFCVPLNGNWIKLAQILNEVAFSYESDADVIIEKIDAVANNLLSYALEVYPTLVFKSASGKLLKFDGGRSKEDIINFIEKNQYNLPHKSHLKINSKGGMPSTKVDGMGSCHRRAEDVRRPGKDECFCNTDKNEEHHSHEDDVKVLERSGGTTPPSPSPIATPSVCSLILMDSLRRIGRPYLILDMARPRKSMDKNLTPMLGDNPRR